MKLKYINIACLSIIFFSSCFLLINQESNIFYLRLNLILTCVSLGIVLSLSGLIYQILFNNVLASPYTFGTASSCALAASISIYCGISPYIPSFLGALISIFIILLFNNFLTKDSLLILGIIKAYFFSNLILFFQSLVGYSASITSNKWILGNIGYIDYKINFLFFILSILFFFYINYHKRNLAIIEIGRDFADSLLIKHKEIDLRLLVISGILLSISVSLAGAIGFIGVVIPQVVRSLNNNLSIITTALFGVTYLVVCILIHKFIPTVPLTVIINLLGTPAFIYILIKKLR